MKTFEQWYKEITESIEDRNTPVAKDSSSIDIETATVDSPSTSVSNSEDSHSKMMQDCDDIINSLKALSDKITESEDQDEAINESNPMTATLMSDPIIMGAIIGLTAITGAVIGTTKAAVDGKRNKKIAKEADKDFDKLKKLRLQEVKVESAVEELKKRKKELTSGGSMDEADVKDKPSKGDVDAKKKEALSKMKAKLDIQIENLSSKQTNLKEAGDEFKTGLDTKYGPEKIYGFFSKKVKSLIAQKRDEILQAVTEYKLKHLADKMDPEVKQDLNNRLQKLKADQKKRLTQLKNEQEAEAEKLAKAREEDPAVAKEYEENKDKLEGKEEEKPEEIESTEAEPAGDSSTKTSDEEEDDDFDAFGVDNEEDEEPEVDKTDNSKEGMVKRVDAVIKKAEESGDEEKLQKAKELKDKILAKESWQIENTKLGVLLEAEIKKIEFSEMIKESISVKDRFSKLI